MADSFIRRLRILQMLKRKDDGIITIPEIIKKLSNQGIEITRNKTVERDMVFLSTVLNIGCDDTKRPFEWWWAENQSIDIPEMGRNSALSFYLAQQYLEPLLPKQSLDYLKPKFRQSKKILAGKNKKKEKNWINKIRVIPKSIKHIRAEVLPKVEKTVYEALYEEKMLHVTYKSPTNKDITIRRINPLALIYRGNTTEILFCEEDSTQVKRFILNRIIDAHLQIQNALIPDNFDLDNYIEKKLGFPGSCEIIEFKAWIHPHARQYVEETPLNEYQIIEEMSDGSINITASIRETAELTTWILSLGPRIKVLEPEFLKWKISDLIDSMSEMYQ